MTHRVFTPLHGIPLRRGTAASAETSLRAAVRGARLPPAAHWLAARRWLGIAATKILTTAGAQADRMAMTGPSPTLENISFAAVIAYTALIADRRNGCLVADGESTLSTAAINLTLVRGSVTHRCTGAAASSGCAHHVSRFR